MAIFPCPACSPTFPGTPHLLPNTNSGSSNYLLIPGRLHQIKYKMLSTNRSGNYYTAARACIHGSPIVVAMANFRGQDYFVQQSIEIRCETAQGSRKHLKS